MKDSMQGTETLLEGLFRRRLIGEYEGEFALTYVERVEKAEEGRTTVHRFYLHPLDTHPYVTDAAGRRETIERNDHMWGAAGFCPLVRFSDGSLYVAALYRDGGAPSYPDYYTTPSGLSHMLEDRAEPVGVTGEREYKEELIFLDSRNPGSVFHDEGTGRFVGRLNELSVPQRLIKDGKTRVEVYQGDRMIDAAYPFAMGWSRPEDTVTTLIDLCVLHPDETIPLEYMQMVNGEVVGRKVFSRDVALLGFDELVRDDTVPVIQYSTDIERDTVTRSEFELKPDELKMTFPLVAAVEKIRETPEEERRSWLE